MTLLSTSGAGPVITGSTSTHGVLLDTNVDQRNQRRCIANPPWSAAVSLVVPSYIYSAAHKDTKCYCAAPTFYVEKFWIITMPIAAVKHKKPAIKMMLDEDASTNTKTHLMRCCMCILFFNLLLGKVT